MAENKDSDFVAGFAIKQVVRKTGKISATQTVRHEVKTFRIVDDGFHDSIKLVVKPGSKIWTSFCEIMRAYLAKIFC